LRRCETVSTQNSDAGDKSRRVDYCDGFKMFLEDNAAGL
jgi:hypothetical protein